MSESMAKIRQKVSFFRTILMYQGAWSTDHGTVEPSWNFFFALEPLLYIANLPKVKKSSTYHEIFFIRC